jgi:hypothetical protein
MQTLPPAVNTPWPDQGGIYAGIARGRDGQPDAHVIVADEKPGGPLTWQDALDWAKALVIDGHSDFALPTRFQAALLYANAAEQFETDDWYWTSTEYSERHAWVQNFSYGGQSGTGKSYEARARAVRLIPVIA